MNKLIIPFIVICILGMGSGAWVYVNRNSPKALFITPTPTPVVSDGACGTDINDKEIIRLTNIERAKQGLKYLIEDPRLDQSALMKTNDMIANNYWAHVSPTGVEPWFWIKQAGYKYTYAGENLSKDNDTSTGVIAGWMNSPEHRDNILNTHYTDIGVANVCSTLLGKKTTLVVAHYGN